MAWQGGATAADQQAKTIIQPGGDLFCREQLDPRGGQLQGQRDAIQPLANGGDGGGVAGSQGKMRLGGLGALDE